MILAALIYSCSGNPSSSPSSANNLSLASTKSAGKATGNYSGNASSNAAQQILNTNKMKSDLNDVLSSSAGKPDSNKLKHAASDILSTDAAMLYDSGIDKLYGNSNDPGVKAAKDALLKMRNAMGITPGKSDSIKKAADGLSKNYNHQP